MRFPQPLCLSQVIDDITSEYSHVCVQGVSDRHTAGPGDMVFFFNIHELERFLENPIKDLACIVGPLLPNAYPSLIVPYIAVKRPRLVFQNVMMRLLEIYPKPSFTGIHSLAYVDPKASVGANVSIGPWTYIQPHAVIEDNVSIGSHCIVESFAHLKKGSRCSHHVTVCSHSTLGEDSFIQSHTVIGEDGFGFERSGEQWAKIPHLSGVRIGSKTFIGSHVAIAAGILNPTVIGSCVIIDNHVQVAHHVSIGDGTAIAGCVGIAGSTAIGKNCLIGGGSKINGHIEIADGVQITGMTMVTKSLHSSGLYSSGIPVDTNKEWKRKMIALNKLSKDTFKNKETQNEHENVC